MSKPQRPEAQITKKESKRKGRGFRRVLTDRNHLVIGAFEIFFRKNMGVRYFDKGTLIAILIGLIGIKGLLNYLGIMKWISGIASALFLGLFEMPQPYPFCVLDVFILFCLGMGIYHLKEQKRLRAEGRRINTDYMGISRFGEIGKYLNKENPQFAAYVYVEPLIAFVVSFLALQHSFILGVIGMIGAGRLWYENYLVVREYKDMVYDMEDAATMSGHLEQKKEQDEQAIKAARTAATSPPPIRKQPPIIAPPPIPLMTNPNEEESAMDAIKRIKRKQKGEEN